MSRGPSNVQGSAIVGLGAVTGYGWGVPRLWEGLQSRRTAARLHHDLGGAFPDACWFARVPDETSTGVGSTRYQRAISFAIEEALQTLNPGDGSPGHASASFWRHTWRSGSLLRARYLAPESVPLRRAYVEQLDDSTRRCDDHTPAHRPRSNRQCGLLLRNARSGDRPAADELRRRDRHDRRRGRHRLQR